MVINTQEFKDVCKTLLSAIAIAEVSTLNEALQINTDVDTLYLSTTNGEHFTQIKFPINHKESLHTCVNATLFLKLISQITTETIELSVQDNYLKIVGNGTYKLEQLTDAVTGKVMQLTPIEIHNVITTMDIPGGALNSIYTYNSKQLESSTIAKAVQKLFYLDEEGCITFTTGACVNNFSLSQPIKLLLNSRVVSMFKLFKNDMVKLTFGCDALSDTLNQTKACFETATVKTTVILPDSALINDVPVNIIRKRADKHYENKVVVNCAELTDALNRVALFTTNKASSTRTFCKFIFTEDTLIIADNHDSIKEKLSYCSETTLTNPYTMILDMQDIKVILSNYSGATLAINFGDDKACCVVVRGAVKNVIPQVREK